jgi:hypothetical protein
MISISRILAFASSMLLGLQAPGEAPAPAPAPASEPAPPAASGADATPPAPATQPAAQLDGVVDVVLPCGLRVITARDASLPVAAVVLAVEVGTRDDPDKLPGLVHALAYHLQQGNRELAPGEAIATAHDVGGIAAMAVGPAQVRFESLVPISALDAQLRVESLRLQAPNTGRELWLKALSYARNDDAVKLLVPREAIAAAWQDPNLAHDGRQVSRVLGDMLDQAVGAQLSRLYDYRLATLVVVGPEDPQALLARVEPLFAGLSARPRKLMSSAAAPPIPVAAPAAAPAVVHVAKQKGDSMVWAVSGDPRARAWAQVLCGTLNRQARRDDEPAKARIRCTYEDDPRRPILLLRAIGFDPAAGPEPLIAKRLDRIAAVATNPTLEPELAQLIEEQRLRIETDLRFDLRTPLELATYLASAAERQGPSTTLRERDEVLGLPLVPASTQAPTPEPAPPPEPTPSKPGGKNSELAQPDPPAPSGDAAARLIAAIPELLDTRRGVLLLDSEQAAPPPVHPPAPSVGEPAKGGAP